MPEQIELQEANVSPFVDWVNPPTVDDLRDDLVASYDYHDSKESEISDWLDELNITGKVKRTKQAGRSNIQPKLIRKHAEWRYAALSEPFLSTDKLFTVNPTTWADKERAVQNEILLNNQFDTVIDKVYFVDNYVRTAVNEGTVICRIGWVFEEREILQRLPVYRFRLAETDAEIAGTAKLIQMYNQDRQGFDLTAKAFQKRLVNIFNTSGAVYTSYIDSFEEREVTETVRDHPTVEVLDYRNVYIDPTSKGDFSRAKFVIHSFETSYAELVKQRKFGNLENINIPANAILSDAIHTTEVNSFRFADRPRQQVVAYEYWGFWDIHGTGETVPITATFVGDTMIYLTESPFPDEELPFVVVPYLPRRNDLYGEPDGSLLKDNQDVIGALTRGMIDVMGRSAAGQKGIRKDALDATNRRKYNRGDDYEFNPTVDPRSAIIDHNFPELPVSTQFMMQLQNGEAESLTGVRPFGATNTNDLGDSATAVRGALDAASKRELGILRRLAKGITEIGRKVTALNAIFLEENQVVRVTDDEYVNINTDDLDGSFDIQLSITTAEEDNQKAQELAFMLQTMGNSMDLNLSKIILAEIARLRKMPVLSRTIENFDPQPDPLQQQNAMLQLQLLQAQIAEVQSRTIENQVDARLDAARTQTELARIGKMASETDLNNLRFLEQESGVAHARDLQRLNQQSQGNINLEVTKAALSESLNPVLGAPEQGPDATQTQTQTQS